MLKINARLCTDGSMKQTGTDLIHTESGRIKKVSYFELVNCKDNYILGLTAELLNC